MGIQERGDPVSRHEFAYAGWSTGVDVNGVEWTLEKSTGWDEGTGVRTAREVRAQQDGEWAATPYRAAREVTLQGKAFAPSHEALTASGRAFAGLPLGDVLTGVTDGVALSGAATLLDGPRFEHAFVTHAVWQLALVMPDPLLYGHPSFGQTTLAAASGGAGLTYPLTYPRDYGTPPGVTPGSVFAANVGTATYWPTLRIDGPVPNPVVQLAETGDWIRYGGTLSAPQWLDIDCATRSVLLNGQVSVRHLVTASGAWLAIHPGGGSVVWSGDSADPAATLSVWSYEGAFQ